MNYLLFFFHYEEILEVQYMSNKWRINKISFFLFLVSFISHIKTHWLFIVLNMNDRNKKYNKIRSVSLLLFFSCCPLNLHCEWYCLSSSGSNGCEVKIVYFFLFLNKSKSFVRCHRRQKKLLAGKTC